MRSRQSVEFVFVSGIGTLGCVLYTSLKGQGKKNETFEVSYLLKSDV